MHVIHHKDDFALNGAGFHWFHGVIEDVNDPLQLGRVRVRCVGYHTDNRTTLPTSGLPWALCLLPNTSASMAGVGQSATGLQPGSWVIGFFRDGPSAQDPIIMGSIASKISTQPDKTKGFSDPSGTNPTKLGADIPIEAVYSSKCGPKDNFNLSLSLSYIAPVYPYNQVIKTRSGHLIEYDDTPSAERISLMHKTGAFIEIDPSGRINICGSKINLVAPSIYQNIRTGSIALNTSGADTTISFEALPSSDYVIVIGCSSTNDNYIPKTTVVNSSSFKITQTGGSHGSGTYFWAAIHQSNTVNG